MRDMVPQLSLLMNRSRMLGRLTQPLHSHEPAIIPVMHVFPYPERMVVQRYRQRCSSERQPLFACRSAKANGVEPHAYLSLMLDKLPNAKSAEDFEALLPWNLKFGLTAGSQSPSPSRESME